MREEQQSNNGPLGKRSAWRRRNGLFEFPPEFDWTAYDGGKLGDMETNSLPKPQQMDHHLERLKARHPKALTLALSDAASDLLAWLQEERE